MRYWREPLDCAKPCSWSEWFVFAPFVQDPYANSFKPRWRSVGDWPNKEDRKLGRAGWVAERKYEIDSGAYYLSFLWNYWCTASTVSCNPVAIPAYWSV